MSLSLDENYCALSISFGVFDSATIVPQRSIRQYFDLSSEHFTPVLFCGIFWWLTSLNVSHWSKRVMHAKHLVKITINNDVTCSVLFVARALDGRLADWSIQDFSPHFLMSYHKKYCSKHYNRNVMDIVVCAITNNWMANNALHLV